MTADPLHQFETGAVRSTDADDVRYDLISPIALDEIARTCKEGADKYGDANWLRGMPVSDLLNHALRHVYMFLSGDRSEPHLPHAAWGLMAAIHSHKQWPHLNGNLLGPGCVPPPPRDEPPAAGPTVSCHPRTITVGNMTIAVESAGSVVKGDVWETPAEKADGDLARAFKRGEERAKAASPGGPCGDCPAESLCAANAECLHDPDRDPANPGGQCDTCPTPNACEGFAAWGFVRLCEPFPAPVRRKPHRIPRLNDPRDGSVPPPVLYLSGPMSGIKAYNFPAFNKAAEKLRQKGFPVLNPADFGWGESDWSKNLARDLSMLGHAEILVQLPGWENSRGASLEYNTAVSLGLGVASLGEILDLA